MFFGQTKGARRLSNTLRRVGTLIIAVLFTTLLTVVTWGQTLDKGTYTISNTVSHDNPVGQGMARSYTEETSDVEVNDSGIFVTLGFNNTQYMGDFTISVGGSKVTYETTTHANNIKKLKFKVPSLGSSIKVGLYVTAMDTNVEYTVTLNESSLKLIKKAETAPVPTPQQSTSANNTSTSSNANSGASNDTSSHTNNTVNSGVSNSTSSTTTTNKPVASTTTSNSSSATVQENSVSKNQATTHEPTTEKAEKTEVAQKTETKATEKTETAQEEAEKVEVVSQEETKVETETTEKDVVEAKTDAEVQGEVEAEEEKTDEQVEEQTEEEKATESEESEETQITSSNGLSIFAIIGGSVVIAIISVVIYLKRK